ncbi:MAG: hypothetical protein DWG76_03055 [Chloroflexi bacterium]|nr:hypothetical protein [Chloroflexota bacterium]
MATNKIATPTPAWLYAVLAWLKGTPLGGGVFAAIVFVLGIFFIHWPLWQTNQISGYGIDPTLIFPATWFPMGLLFWLWQDGLAERVLRDFGNGVGKSERQIRAIYNEFVSIPNSTALILSGVGLVMGGFYSATQASQLGVSGIVFILLSSIVPTLGSTLELLGIWRWVKQLIQINKLYKEIEQINLFNLWPVYALSRYGYTLALLAISFTIFIDVVIRLDGGNGLPFYNIIYTVFFGLLVFIVPLLGINRRLQREKRRDLQRLGIELKSLYDETEIAVRERTLEKVNVLHSAANSLKTQMESIQKVATWPWTPGSLRNLLLPILIPLFIAILQRYVLTWLGLS